MVSFSSKRTQILSLILCLLLAVLLCSCEGIPYKSLSLSLEEQHAAAVEGDKALAELYEQKKSDVQVQGEGRVARLLADDLDGSAHQRFVLQLASGQTLLMSHNIDLAPRISGLGVGDTVAFYGEYFYNEQGGGIHWTHHDPDKEHVDGWLLWNGTYYA